MSKLDSILALPFEQYMQACWQHVHDKALTDPMVAVVYGWMRQDPSNTEAQWAKRYWFCKAKESSDAYES
jgi:hypothetical protein